jgi:hypothetical protein
MCGNGTLTYGEPKLTEPLIAPGFTQKEVLILVAGLERYSEPPLARAILASAKVDGITLPEATGGHGGQRTTQPGPARNRFWDKGFYKARALRRVAERGAYFLMPWPRSVGMYRSEAAGPRGPRLEVAAELKAQSQNTVEWAAVELGQTQESRLGPVRLIAHLAYRRFPNLPQAFAVQINGLPTWMSAIQQAWKPALRLGNTP